MAASPPTEANAPVYNLHPPGASGAATTGQTPTQYAANYSATGMYQTRDQAISGLASSMLLEYLNGSDANHPNGLTEPFWANSWWTSHGLQLPPSSAYGSVATGGATNPAQQQQLWDLFSRAASARVSEDPVYSQLPAVSGSANPPPTPNQQSINDTSTANTAANNAANAAVQAGINATSTANTAANNAAALARTNADNAAALARAQLASGDSRYSTDVRAQTDREATAATERIATGDRTSREGIAARDLAEKGREFDLNIVEDRRQFNATTLTGLLNTGVQLAKNPVDWLAYQFYMQNIGIPVTALNLTNVASMLGAVPPSGPSAAGPMIGGPAIMDGDTAVSQQLGISNAGFVSVSAAVAAFPTGFSPESQNVAFLSTEQTYPIHVQQAGGAQQLDQAVSQGRATEVAAAVAPNPVIQKAVQEYTPQLQAAPVQAPAPAPVPSLGPNEPDAAPSALHMVGGSPFGPTPTANPAPVAASWTPPTPLTAPSAAPPMAAPPAPQSFTPVTPLTAPSAAPVVGASGHVIDMNGLTNMGAPTVTVGGNTGGGNTGIYTGPTATTPAVPLTNGGSVPSPISTTANTAPATGSDMLQLIANELGVPLATVQQLVPPNLLSTAASKETIMASPQIQAYINSNAGGVNYYRTADASGSKFGTIQAYGIPTGVRGGQDLNAQSYLNMDDPSRAMFEGTIAATGMDPSNELKKAFRASPISNYDSGSFGRRVA